MRELNLTPGVILTTKGGRTFQLVYPRAQRETSEVWVARAVLRADKRHYYGIKVYPEHSPLALNEINVRLGLVRTRGNTWDGTTPGPIYGQRERIAQMIAFGRVPNRRERFLVSEYVDATLSDRLGVNPREFSRESRIRGVATQVLQGLVLLHDHGIVHLDIKPSNIGLVGGGNATNVKILDFGSARALFSFHRNSGIIRMDSEAWRGFDREALAHGDGSVISGTPRYASPEQFRQPWLLHGASDVYSLGCVLYELMSGRAIFHDHAGFSALAVAHQTEVPDRAQLMSGYSAALVALVGQMLVKEHSRRIDARSALAKLLDIGSPGIGESGDPTARRGKGATVWSEGGAGPPLDPRDWPGF